MTTQHGPDHHSLVGTDRTLFTMRVRTVSAKELAKRSDIPYQTMAAIQSSGGMLLTTIFLPVALLRAAA